MSRGLLVFVAALIFLATFSLSVSSKATADSQIITDVSWPNCNAKTYDVTSVGIVGVNDGLDHSNNPCLNDESLLFHNLYALYLNTGYPGINYGIKFAHYPNNCKLTNYLCIAYNYGYDDVTSSIKYANEQDTHSFVWWLDVETENSWTTSYQQNREALIGMISALDQHAFMPTIGFYSYPGQWKLITKSWKNNYPSWVASASSNKNIAISYCSKSFSSGAVWLTQYTTELDYNYNCLPNAINNFKIR